ncbi:MAG: FAD:protein FMN transferase, partial [Elusimicrobia bacterium]|nr:FAD:protein FMN transferase [Elusimicrobiota bacterium]
GLLLALALLAAPAGAAEPRADRARWLMGTLCEIQARGEDADAAVTAAFGEIERWDRILSSYKKESELSALNRSAGRGPFRASAELYAATDAALRLAQASGGAFDPTAAPLLRRGPSALPLVGWAKVRLDPAGRTIELPREGMALDFGGIGKGWALDQAAKALRRRGVSNAFLNFGGQILALGRPESGDAWPAILPGLAEPLRLRDASVSTSGDSERPGHIVSPFDGKPVRRRLQATAVLPGATEADAWSTALYVLGKAPPSFPGQAFFTPAPIARTNIPQPKE